MSQVSDEEILQKIRPYEVEYLYKYRAINSMGLERTFANNEVYLPDPTSFNDPFDCKPRLTIHKSEYKKREYYKSVVKNRFPNASSQEIKYEVKHNTRIRKLDDVEYLEYLFSEFMQGFGVYCLAEVPDDILMWSHYSNSHKGICLQFDATKESSIIWEAFKVTYQDIYPTVNVMEMDDLNRFFNIVATKSQHWAYEKERRVIKTSDDGGSKIYSFEPKLLTGVILGAKISHDDEKTVLAWVDKMNANVRIYRAKMNTKSYRLDIKGINC